MNLPLNKIVFVLDEFALKTPGQQLLDRFLAGYPRDGKFHRPSDARVIAHFTQKANAAAIEQRVRDFGLIVEPDLNKALADADGALLFTGSASKRACLERLPERARCFVWGLLAEKGNEARELIELSRQRRIVMSTGTALPVTWHLPQLPIPNGASIHEALVVALGEFPQGELEALECLLLLIERRWRPQKATRVFGYEGDAVWEAGRKKVWSWDLLSSALSRSDSPLGDPVKDGRTQNLVGLQLVQKLATKPRAWILEHHDGLRSQILMLDGVAKDFTFALRGSRGFARSGQIFRPVQPQQHEFSPLAAALENFFRSGELIAPLERSLTEVRLLEAFHRPEAKTKEGIGLSQA